MDKQFSVHSIYYGSDGAKTRSLLRKLEQTGIVGQIAAQLFRAQKYSSRAKGYRGGIRQSSGRFTSYRDLAYDGKEKALGDLCTALTQLDHGLIWGWNGDPAQRRNKHVLYVDLPNGQLSFHSPERLEGPDYAGVWDQQHGSETRIIEFCQELIGASTNNDPQSKFVCTRKALESSPIERVIE